GAEDDEVRTPRAHSVRGGEAAVRRRVPRADPAHGAAGRERGADGAAPAAALRRTRRAGGGGGARDERDAGVGAGARGGRGGGIRARTAAHGDALPARRAGARRPGRGADGALGGVRRAAGTVLRAPARLAPPRARA